MANVVNTAKVLPDLAAQNAALMAEIAALKAAVEKRNTVTVKVNALGLNDKDGNPCKGTVSVYGINTRFPISLYAEQWERLIAAVPSIQAAIAAADKAGTVARRTKATA